MTKVAIIGATGYTALELIRILLRHPHARIEALTSREAARPAIADIHPSLTGRIDRHCEAFDPVSLSNRIDCAFLALPHGAGMSATAQLLSHNVRVVDLSADYRLRDPNVYAEWYGQSHTDVENLRHAVYGLPELYGSEIAPARLVANPGCFPTGAILGLAPLLAGECIEKSGIVIDSKSGVSGAGRTPKLATHFPECNESVSAYNVGKHRHMPEIEQILSDVCAAKVEIVFTPHLIPMDRGIFTTAYARLSRPTTAEQLIGAFRAYYAGKAFVRVVDRLPTTRDTMGTNFCDVTVRVVRDCVIVLTCIDNLVKGAAGAAVQNFNLMFGYPETTALL